MRQTIVTDVGNVARYTLKIQKSVVFQYTSYKEVAYVIKKIFLSNQNSKISRTK